MYSNVLDENSTDQWDVVRDTVIGGNHHNRVKPYQSGFDDGIQLVGDHQIEDECYQDSIPPDPGKKNLQLRNFKFDCTPVEAAERVKMILERISPKTKVRFSALESLHELVCPGEIVECFETVEVRGKYNTCKSLEAKLKKHCATFQEAVQFGLLMTHLNNEWDQTEIAFVAPNSAIIRRFERSWHPIIYFSPSVVKMSHLADESVIEEDCRVYTHVISRSRR